MKKNQLKKIKKAVKNLEKKRMQERNRILFFMASKPIKLDFNENCFKILQIENKNGLKGFRNIKYCYQSKK